MSRAVGAVYVVVTSGGAPPTRMKKCVDDVLATVPDDVQVEAITTLPLALGDEASTRVRVRRVQGEKDAKRLIATRVATSSTVITVNAGFDLSPGWYAHTVRMLQNHPTRTGVYEESNCWVFAFPSAVTSIDADQMRWPTLAGVIAAPAEGSVPRRPLSAVLITKNEEHYIGGCISAVAPFVDDVVVYDTGSTDDTIQLAEEAGATVVAGHWDGDFAAARNRALEHATTDWVLVVDADEYATGNPEAFRLLVDKCNADVIVVPQVSVSWSGATNGSAMQQARVFRRSESHYTGALHEQVTANDPNKPHRFADGRSALQLRHFGYLATQMTSMGKAERNLAAAEVGLRSCPPSDDGYPHALANYARSLALVGKDAESLDAMDGLLALSARGGDIVLTGRTAVELALRANDLGRWDRWIDAMEGAGEAPGHLVTFRARRLLHDGDVTAAQQLLEGLDLDGDGGGCDCWGNVFEPDNATALLAHIYLIEGKAQLAHDLMLRALNDRPDTVNVDALFSAASAAGSTVEQLLRQSPQAFIDRSLRELASLEPERSLGWFNALHAHDPTDYRPVVAGCTIAPWTNWLTALLWQSRSVELGLGLRPLRDLAQQDGRSPVERLMAWALLAEAFGEPDAFGEFVALLDALPGEAQLAALEQVGQYAPDTLKALQQLAAEPASV